MATFKMNKETIRSKYAEDLQFLVMLAAKHLKMSHYDGELLQMAYEHTRFFHVIAALQLLAAAEGKDIRQGTLPAIQQIREMFEAMERITKSAK